MKMQLSCLVKKQKKQKQNNLPNFKTSQSHPSEASYKAFYVIERATGYCYSDQRGYNDMCFATSELSYSDPYFLTSLSKFNQHLLNACLSTFRHV